MSILTSFGGTNSDLTSYVQMFGMFLAISGSICYNTVGLTVERHDYNAERKIEL